MFPCLVFIHLTAQVFPGNSVSLCLHNLLPELASLISEEISIELEDLHTKHVHSFLHLIHSLPGLFKCCLHCNDCDMRRFVTLCLFELFGLVWCNLAGSNCLLGGIVPFPLLKLIL